jgi:ATP-binding cassette, subfamily B, bacterial PglK
MLISVIGAAAEVAVIGAMIPFTTLLTQSQDITGNKFIESLLRQFGLIGSIDVVPVITLFFALIVLLAAFLRLAIAWASVRFAQGLGHDIGVRVYERMLFQPYAYHASRNSSEVLAGANKVSAVVTGVFTPALDAFTACILAAAILAGLLIIDSSVALLAVVLFGLVYWTLSKLSKGRIVNNSRVISRNASARIKTMQEGLGGIRDVLLDGSQGLHLKRFSQADLQYRHAQAQNDLWAQMPRYIVEGLGIGGIAGIAAYAAMQKGTLAGALPVLGALALGAQRILPLFQRIYAGWNQVAGNIGNMEDVASLASAPLPEGIKLEGDPSALPFNKSLTLNNIGFRYRNDLRWVFRNINISIAKGARIGFSGKTGSGKSTLLDLVMGLLEPSEGEILVDGTIVGPNNMRHWQARIAHVPQNIFLSDTSIAENIAFGEPRENVDMHRVELASRRARIHDFINSLENGYETTVGERGVRLSGGQRQRLGIARALYRHADVMILDEATSALDGMTEASVMEGIAELGSDITVLIVAHRLSTLELCDRVIELETLKNSSEANAVKKNTTNN